MSDHYRPTAEIAPAVVLPSDPGLAMALAQRLTEKPLMANHHHGLWGYSGRTPAGFDLTVQATGIGGPSASVVIAELAAHGARRIVRVGRCESLDPALSPGAAVVVSSALGDDGVSAALGIPVPRPDEKLHRAVATVAPAMPNEVVAGCDSLVRLADAAYRRRLRDRGATVADLESAAVLAACARLGVAAACLLVVSRGEAGQRDEEAVERALDELGGIAARALAAVDPAAEAQAPGPAARSP